MRLTDIWCSRADLPLGWWAVGFQRIAVVVAVAASLCVGVSAPARISTPWQLVPLLLLIAQEGAILLYKHQRRRILIRGDTLLAVVMNKRLSLGASVAWMQVCVIVDGHEVRRTVIDSYDYGAKVFVGDTTEVRLCLNGLSSWFPGFLEQK